MKQGIENYMKINDFALALEEVKTYFQKQIEGENK